MGRPVFVNRQIKSNWADKTFKKKDVLEIYHAAVISAESVLQQIVQVLFKVFLRWKES